jgi:ABC-type lipoprotein export system ATPase subunit
MEQKGRVKHIFPGGNTSQGFYSFFDSVLHNMDRIFIIKGGPGTGKSTLIRLVGMAMVDRGHDIEYLHCASDNDSLDGVVMTDLKVAIVDGTAPHGVVA